MDDEKHPHLASDASVEKPLSARLHLYLSAGDRNLLAEKIALIDAVPPWEAQRQMESFLGAAFKELSAR